MDHEDGKSNGIKATEIIVKSAVTAKCEYCHHSTHERANCPHEALSNVRKEYERLRKLANEEQQAHFRQHSWDGKV